MTAELGGPRLVRPETSPSRKALHAATICTLLAAVAVVGIWSTPIALLAAGAGAGYSLSGSV